MKFSPVFVRSENNYDMQEASLASSFDTGPESLTVQSDRDDADINVLVKRFGLTGVMPQNVRAPAFQDFEDVFDFQSAMNAIRASQESFDRMPADVRSRFGNSPQSFLEFCSEVSEDGKTLKNLAEMRKMGLAIPEKVEVESPPQRVVVVEENGHGEVGSASGVGKGAKASD